MAMIFDAVGIKSFVDSVAICAVRHCLGQQTQMAVDVAEWLRVNWESLSAETQTILRLNITAAIKKDTLSREKGEKNHPLGLLTDRKAWLKVERKWLP